MTPNQNHKHDLAGTLDLAMGMLLCLPTHCLLAGSIELAFGDVHDCYTPNHHCERLRDFVAEVEDHVYLNGARQ